MSKLKKYYDLKQEIKRLTAEVKLIENQVFTEVMDEDGEKITTDYCKFQIAYRPRWKYSKKVTDAEKLTKEKFKLLKKKEEIDGTAEKVSEGCHIRITELKG